MAAQQVTLKMTRPEAMALLNAAETGLRVIEALNLVKNVGLTEESVRKLRAAARRGKRQRRGVMVQGVSETV